MDDRSPSDPVSDPPADSGVFESGPTNPGQRPALTDLLHPEPTERYDRYMLRQALVFAFTSGDPTRSMAEVLDAGELPASSWDSQYFANDLFMDELVERALTIRLENHEFVPCRGMLKRILVSSPSRDTTEFRHAVFAELLSSPELAGALGTLYVALRKFRDLLCGPDYGSRLDAQSRRLDVFRAVYELPQRLEPFSGSHTALARLAELGSWIQNEPSYQRLTELLDYEENAAEVELRLRLGHDGAIRSLTPLALRENLDNPYYISWWRRLASRLTLFFRGWSVNGAEISGRYIDEVFSGLEEPMLHLLQLSADLEFYLAGLDLSRRAKKAGLEMALPRLGASDTPCRIEGLFNLMLFADGVDVVACKLDLATEPPIVILTGPNSGGKTRLLQSVAHAQLLGQAGFLVPASEASLPWAEGLFVSLIEPASANQSEGRLGTELIRIRKVFEQLRHGSLVLLDELCSGTNPSEGEEIFRLVVELLQELNPRAFITTHFLTFAEQLRRDRPELTFLEVGLDSQDYPTFQFVPGVARTSLAQRTAARLGVTADQLRGLMLQNNPELRQARQEGTPDPDPPADEDG